VAVLMILLNYGTTTQDNENIIVSILLNII